MTDREFHLMSAIAHEDLSNGDYLFAEDVENTTEFCGIAENIKLPGRWLLVYRKADDNPFITDGSRMKPEHLHPDQIGHFDYSDEVLLMYRLTTHADENAVILQVPLKNIDNEGLTILQEFRENPEDIIYIDENLHRMKYKLGLDDNSKTVKVSQKRAKEILGDRVYWSGISRAAFHHDCRRDCPDDNTVHVEFELAYP